MKTLPKPPSSRGSSEALPTRLLTREILTVYRGANRDRMKVLLRDKASRVAPQIRPEGERFQS